MRLTHRNLVVNIDQFVASMPPVHPGETTVAVMPFFPMFGLTVLASYTQAQKRVVVTMLRFDLDGFLELIAAHQVRQLYVVPPIVVALAKHPLVDEHDLSSLEMILSPARRRSGRRSRAP